MSEALDKKVRWPQTWVAAPQKQTDARLSTLTPVTFSRLRSDSSFNHTPDCTAVMDSSLDEVRDGHVKLIVV